VLFYKVAVHVVVTSDPLDHGSLYLVNYRYTLWNFGYTNLHSVDLHAVIAAVGLHVTGQEYDENKLARDSSFITTVSA